MSYSNILTLTGLPCSGKTSIGSKLAQKLSYSCIDLDHYIINKHNKSISEIFNLLGEDKFREYESTALTDILNYISPSQHLVLILGGGTVCFYNNLQLCLNKTTLIWLNTQFDIIYRRLLQSSNLSRPIFTTSNLYTELQDLHNKRLHFYNQSHIKVNITENCLNYSVDSILDSMNNYYGN